MIQITTIQNRFSTVPRFRSMRAAGCGDLGSASGFSFSGKGGDAVATRGFSITILIVWVTALLGLPSAHSGRGVACPLEK